MASVELAAGLPRATAQCWRGGEIQYAFAAGGWGVVAQEAKAGMDGWLETPIGCDVCQVEAQALSKATAGDGSFTATNQRDLFAPLHSIVSVTDCDSQISVFRLLSANVANVANVAHVEHDAHVANNAQIIGCSRSITTTRSTRASPIDTSRKVDRSFVKTVKTQKLDFGTKDIN